MNYVAATPLPATKYVFCVQGDWHPNSPQWEEEEEKVSRMSISISASSLLPGLDMRAMLHAQGGTATDPSHAFSHSIPGSGRKHRTLDGPL